MSTDKRSVKYDEEFKRTLINLYHNGGKTQEALCKEYGVSLTLQFGTGQSYKGKPRNFQAHPSDLCRLQQTAWRLQDRLCPSA